MARGLRRRAWGKAPGWILPIAVGAAVLSAPVDAQQPQRSATFRAGTDLVRVDVIVRDKNGATVRGLKATDFLIQEDGRPQQITSFDFEEISTSALPPAAPPALLGVERLQAAAAVGVTVAPSAGRGPGATPAAASSPATPETTQPANSETAGRRLIV